MEKLKDDLIKPKDHSSLTTYSALQCPVYIRAKWGNCLQRIVKIATNNSKIWKSRHYWQCAWCLVASLAWGLLARQLDQPQALEIITPANAAWAKHVSQVSKQTSTYQHSESIGCKVATDFVI